MVRVRVDGFIEPCIPTRAERPPAGPDWVHEIKHDGFRLIVHRDGENLRLYTRKGYGRGQLERTVELIWLAAVSYDQRHILIDRSGANRFLGPQPVRAPCLTDLGAAFGSPLSRLPTLN